MQKHGIPPEALLLENMLTCKFTKVQGGKMEKQVQETIIITPIGLLPLPLAEYTLSIGSIS